MEKVYVKKSKHIPEKGFHYTAMVLLILLAIYSIIPFFLMLAVSISTAISSSRRRFPSRRISTSGRSASRSAAAT